MIRRALVLAGLLALGGCELSVGSDNDAEMGKVQYYHDAQAELCFAAYRMDRSYGFFVAVPCTPGVVAVALPLPRGGAK